jgi:hypothetical protein
MGHLNWCDRIKENRQGHCPLCGSPYLSKPTMVCEILKKLKYPKEKSRHNDGTFTRDEVYWIYSHIDYVAKRVIKEADEIHKAINKRRKK